MVLSSRQIIPILQARSIGNVSVQTSLDLGLTATTVTLDHDGIKLPHGGSLTWEQLEEIHVSENNCFMINAGQIDKIISYSEHTERVYSLYPTQGAPTMLVSGIPMHRIKDTDPNQDTLEKIKTLKPIHGMVLDTTTGLGYTAIQAAKTAEAVLTVELDAAAIEIARCNPWSKGLFDDPKISRQIADSFEFVRELEERRIACIIHDPPAFSLAGQLYSSEFYVELFRILKPNGRLFHYIGNPESKSGRNITRGVKERLRAVGFRRIIDRPRAFGVLAVK